MQALKKKPVQERAKVTMAAIMEAAGQVLAAEGLLRTTTHRIAKRAGVSVGTLYQYFPNKQAVLMQLLRNYREESLQRLVDNLAGTADLPLEDVISRAVDSFVEPFFSYPEVSRALMQNRDAFISPQERVELMRTIQQFVVAALAQRNDIPPLPDPELVAFNLVRTADALSVAAVTDRPESLLDRSHQRELTHLLVSYLKTPRP